jgi:hypothetical protein
MLVALDELEIHSGHVAGRRRTPPGTAPPAIPGGGRAVLEHLLREALMEPPAYVAFSGGRDSSAILALATHVARREGLPDPVPLTSRYEEPEAQETEWQEGLVQHLGLREWVRYDIGGRFDVLGPIARRALDRHGLFWPPMAHNMLILGEHASGGTLLTGGGGDELLSGWMWHPSGVRSWRDVRSARAALATALDRLPVRVRHAVALRMHQRREAPLPWLTPQAHEELQRRNASEEPALTFPAAIEAYLDGRYLEVLRTVLDAFARDAGVRLLEPLYDPRLLRAVAQDLGRDGFPDRTTAFRTYFGDVLPAAWIERSTKAHFTRALWGPEARAFAARWDGRGVDPELVDVEVLRRMWAQDDDVDVRTLSLLQRTYVAGAR